MDASGVRKGAMKYPIYHMSAKWKYEKDASQVDNSTCADWMERVELTEEQLSAKAIEIAEQIRKSEEAKGRPLVSPINIQVKFVEMETWCLGWFTHLTFNLFASEEEAFHDFDDFVARKQMQNVLNGHHENMSVIGNSNPYHCLMGAEDRWRWKLCGCDICKQDGMTIIQH